MLVLDLDATDFLLDFVVPVPVLGFSPLLVLILEFFNFLKFKFIFYFQASLVDALAEKNVQDWLYLDIVVKEIIVLNLGDLVDTRLLWDILWRFRFLLEFVCLQFHFCFLWLLLALLCQKVSEVDINAGRWSWSQVIWACRILRLLELHQLGFDHLYLLSLTLFLDPQLLFLGWSHVLLEQMDVMSISSEDSFVEHNVESRSALLFLGNGWEEHSVLGSTVLVLVSNNLGLCPFKTL